MKKFIACYTPKNYKRDNLYKPIWANNKAEAMKKAAGRHEKGCCLAWMLPSKEFRQSFGKI